MYLCGCMSASDNLSDRQFSVSRGIGAVGHREWEDWTGDPTGFKVQTDHLGTHWSSDPAVPRRFASSPGSSVYHGTVSSASVITDKGDQIRSGADDIDGEYAHEKEVPVRSGSAVQVHRVDKIKANRVRSRRYNPPREMKA